MWWAGRTSTLCLWFTDENGRTFRWDLGDRNAEGFSFPQTRIVLTDGYLERSSAKFKKDPIEYLVFPTELT